MFVANASHELKTPVTNIIGEIEVAISKERSADDYKNTLRSVLVEADRLHDIIRNFLVLANAENNNTIKQKEAERLDELLWELQESFNRHPGTIIEVQLNEMPEDESRLYITTNKTLLTLALNNIIQNGLKFSSFQPVVCSLHFSEASIIITISDSGIGMDAATLKNVFEPFYRSTGANNYPGHGIGLYIAQQTINLLGGTINAQSEAGVGSKFNIVFPQKN